MLTTIISGVALAASQLSGSAAPAAAADLPLSGVTSPAAGDLSLPAPSVQWRIEVVPSADPSAPAGEPIEAGDHGVLVLEQWFLFEAPAPDAALDGASLELRPVLDQPF
jgi:hypothetical protein